MNWRILHIDGFEARLLVRRVYGGAIPIPIARLLKAQQFDRVLRYFTISN